MSETARALGLPGEVEWPVGSDKKLKVSRVHFGIEAKFEEYLEGNRDAALERSRGRMTKAAYEDRLRIAHAEDGARIFAWTNDVAHQAAWSDVGFKRLAFFCIQDQQTNWSREQHDALFEDPKKVRELIQIIHKITLPHPNGSAPGQQPGAPSSQLPSSSPVSSSESVPTTN